MSLSYLSLLCSVLSVSEIIYVQKTSVIDFNVKQFFSLSNFEILYVVVNVNHVQNCFYVVVFFTSSD